MLSETVINKLLEMGGKRWTKGAMDRVYFSCNFLDCEFEYYKTGNVKRAYHKGERMSNADGGRCKAAKSYIDVKTGEATSTMTYLQESLQERLQQALQGEAGINA